MRKVLVWTAGVGAAVPLLASSGAVQATLPVIAWLTCSAIAFTVWVKTRSV